MSKNWINLRTERLFYPMHRYNMQDISLTSDGITSDEVT